MSGDKASQGPPMIAAFMADYGGAQSVDAVLETLRFHLTFSPYAGWKDTIRADVEALTKAWEEYRDKQEGRQ